MRPCIVDNQSFGFSMFWNRGAQAIVNSSQFVDIWNSISQNSNLKSPIMNELIFPARQIYFYGSDQINNTEITSIPQHMTNNREAHNITSHYRYPCGFGDTVKYWLTYGLSLDLNCEQDALIHGLNVINDGYDTTSNYLKFTMQLYNYF